VFEATAVHESSPRGEWISLKEEKREIMGGETERGTNWRGANSAAILVDVVEERKGGLA